MGAMSLFHWLIVLIVLFVPLAVLIAVVVLIVVLFRPQRRSPNLVWCPDCRGMVSRSAPSCPHCGKPLTPSA